jgi:lysophospholipase L1-like esterase
MRELLETFASSGTARFILMTPAFLDSDPQSRSSLLTDACESVIERFAREFAAVLVPSRRALRLAAEQGPSIDFWLPDGIHPSPSGHAVLAASWLESVGAFAPWP